MANASLDERDQLDFFAEDQVVAAVPLEPPDETRRRRDLQRLRPDERVQGLLNVDQLRAQLESGVTIAYLPSRACRRCGSDRAELRQSGNQLPVTCSDCRRVSYNAPKAEVGFAPETLKTLRGTVSPSQQARILDRDHGRCVFCGLNDRLTIGHLLSVADGRRVGATSDELNDDANLATMCDTCNSGFGERSVSLLSATLYHHLLQAERLPRGTASTGAARP